MLQRLDIHHAALCLLGSGNSAHLQSVGVFLQQLIGHLRHSVLGRGGLTAVLHPQCQHHLALPQGNGVHQRGLDLLDHQGIVILQQTGLRTHLNGHHTGQLQIVDLLFKPVAHADQVVIGLCILGKAGLLRLFAQLLQLIAAHVCQTLFPGQNVHGQLFIVLQVQLIHLVKHGHVLEQRDLMILQILGDLVHVGLHLAVLCLHGLDAVAGLFEQARQSLFLLLCAEAFQLHHKAAQILADFAHILVADIGQRTLGKRCHALLGGSTVLQHLIGIPHINLPGELVDRGTLLLRQHAVIQHHRLHFFLHLGCGRSGGGSGCLRGQGQSGNLRSGGSIGSQRQLGHVVVSHHF